MYEIILGIFIVAVAILTVLAPIYFLFYRHHRVTLTETGIQAPRGAFSFNTYEIPFGRITAVDLAQDMLSYGLMFSKISIKTRDRTYTFRGYSQNDAYKLAQAIQAKITPAAAEQ